MDKGNNGGNETDNDSSGKSQKDFIKLMLGYSCNFTQNECQ